MPDDTPVHDFLLPRITAMLNEAETQGIKRDVAVAVLIDIATSPQFDTALPGEDADAPQPADYQRSPDVVLVHGRSVQAPHVPGAQDEADFIRPLRWDR